MKTSIIILTHNQLDMTIRCLESIRSNTSEEIELIVIDNASTDGTIHYLKEQKDIKAIFNSENAGFPRGCNQGVNHASGENILFLNNDTVVTPNWLENMLRVLYSNEKIGMVGPVSNFCAYPQQVPVTYNGIHEIEEFAQKREQAYKGQSLPYPRLVGFCLLIKKIVLDEIGLFDERFGLGNFEDDDLCLRAKMKGFELMIALDSFVHHEGHATFSQTGIDLEGLLNENWNKAREKWGNDIYSLLLDQEPPMTISLCMIVKNEEGSISQCLNCIKDIVDEIIIVDTGSTDRTKELVRDYTDLIYDFEWIDHFSEARNFSFSKATKDYILWLDADDILLEEDQKKLLNIKNTLNPSIDSVTMLYHLGVDSSGNPSLSYRRNRLVKRSNNFQWHGAVHEFLEVRGHITNSDVVVIHTGTHQDSTRNLRIYEKRIENGEAFTPRDLYYYANELLDHKQYNKAIDYYLTFLNSNKGWVEDNISACGKLADIYYHLGDETKEREYVFKSFEYDTPRAEFCCRMGFQFLKKNEYQKAIVWYKIAAELERPKDNWGFFNESCWTWLPHLQLCICYYHLGDYEKAYFHNEKARTFNPYDEKILHNKQFFDDLLKKHPIPSIELENEDSGKRISFISCVKDPLKYQKSQAFIHSLTIPEGFEIQFKSLENMNSIASGYQQMMQNSDAKYKVYLHEDVFIINNNFLVDILSIFKRHPLLGMIGVVGAKTMPKSCIWWESLDTYGKVYDSHTGQMELLSFSEVTSEYESVQAIDGLIMITQYDLPWREDIINGWHFYDTCHSFEFLKAGYDIGIPKQLSPWCIHDCGIRNASTGYEDSRKEFIHHYSNCLNTELGNKWIFHKPVFEYEKDHMYITQESAWSGHRHFAYDLVRFLKPATIVELGTQWGASYFSFLQAIKDEGMNTMCYAVDTWEGDPHAGYYDNTVYEAVSKITDQLYAKNSSLIRCRFDEALNEFEDESIDLLHIDGYHTYEAVSHDFKTWLPKLAKQGVILFHDIAVQRDDFGVHLFWEELKSQYSFIEFKHSYGLGMLFPKGYRLDFQHVFSIVNRLKDSYEHSS
ncbi:glycosyltransferase [Cytobacillus massiliigabonensis]|uniref:glycosyltransferase n=1 Tax=Cytobacillus massiliigabonensis TaxID=1871011 RepID=UPI000C8514F5|nr:glycosyltransferase [Cytobacillus massiliigabonensis]